MSFKTALSWGDAAAACSLVGAHLVTISDEKVNTTVAGIAGTASWIGLTDQFSEGTFVWDEGKNQYTALTYTKWLTNQPDNGPGGNADCVQTTSAGTWSDMNCALLLPYICEYNWPAQ